MKCNARNTNRPTDLVVARWSEMQRELGNPWPPLSLSEINLFGPPTSEYGYRLRVALLVQLLVRSISPITLDDLEPAGIAMWPDAYQLRPQALATLRHEVNEIMGGLQIGVRLNLLPILRLNHGEPPTASFAPIGYRVPLAFGWTMAPVIA